MHSYRSLHKLKNKIKYINNFKKNIIALIESDFLGTYIDNPYLHKDTSKYIFTGTKRKITFDSSDLDGYLQFFNDNMFWMSEKLNQLEIEPNNSLYSLKKFFIRDNNVFDNQPIESEHILVELVVREEDYNKEFIISLSKKLNLIFSKIINNLSDDFLSIENKRVFSDCSLTLLSFLRKRYPLHKFDDILSSIFTSNQSFILLSDEVNKKINTIKFDFDPIQNNLSNTLYFFSYNKFSISNSLIYKISQRPTSKIIINQMEILDFDFNDKKILDNYQKNNIQSYLIDINLSTLFSTLFSEFSLSESSHSPGYDELEKQYMKSKIIIL